MDDFKAVGIDPQARQSRLDWYSNQLVTNKKGGFSKVQALHLKSTFRYLLLSDKGLYECYKVEIIGFNKLNGDWEYNPKTNTLSRLAIEQSYRDFTECRDHSTFPISMTINGVDGISHGLYCVVAKDLGNDSSTVNLLLWIDNGKSRLVDIRNKCPFSIYQLK